MDPVSLALAVAPLLLECGKLVKLCNEVKEKYQSAPETLGAIATECNGITNALVQLQALGLQADEMGEEQQSRFHNAIDSVVDGCSTTLSNVEQHLNKVCEITDHATFNAPSTFRRRDRVRVIWEEDYIDRQLQRLRGYQTNLILTFSMLQTYVNILFSPYGNVNSEF